MPFGRACHVRTLLLIEQTLHDGLEAIRDLLANPVYQCIIAPRQELPVREISAADLPPLIVKTRAIDAMDKERRTVDDHADGEPHVHH